MRKLISISMLIILTVMSLPFAEASPSITIPEGVVAEPSGQVEELPTLINPEAELVLVYYGTSSCLSCAEVEKQLTTLLSTLSEKYEISFVKKDTALQENLEELHSVAAYFGETPSVPTFLVNNRKLLVGVDPILGFLADENLLRSQVAQGVGKTLALTDVAETFLDRFNSFSVVFILIAGLLDGLNPCALAMLMFLMSFVSTLEKGEEGVAVSKHALLIVGWIYAVATFIVYFLIGTGLLSFMLHLTFLPLFLKGIYIATILFCLILFYFNISDFQHLVQGKEEKVKTQLPKKMKHLIHRIIRNKTSLRAIYVSTFFVSVLVSIIDFLCTGQIYLPTMTFILANTDKQLQVYSYLALYNLMFIVPILVVVYTVYYSKSIISSSEVLTKNLKFIKLLGALFYLTLAGVILMFLIQLF